VKIFKKFICLVVVFIIFLFFFHSPFPEYINTYRMQTVDFFYIPLNILSKIYEYLGALFNVDSIVEKNKKLEHQLSDLKFELFRMQNIKQENQELRKILDLKKEFSFESIPAEVIARVNKNFSKIVILNKGNNSGIKVDTAVISHDGLVGKVIEVGDKTSKVILLNDANFKIQAQVKNTDEVGLVLGGVKNNTCIIKYLSQDAKVKLGDVVVTGKYSTFIPAGIPIGEIKNFISSEDMFFRQAIIETYVNLNNIEFVLCLKQE